MLFFNSNAVSVESLMLSMCKIFSFIDNADTARDILSF